LFEPADELSAVDVDVDEDVESPLLQEKRGRLKNANNNRDENFIFLNLTLILNSKNN